jgi:hypothetical protein
MTGVVNEPQIREIVLPPVFLGHHMVLVKLLAILKSLMADRTHSLLAPGELSSAILSDLRTTPSLSPIVL